MAVLKTLIKFNRYNKRSFNEIIRYSSGTADSCKPIRKKSGLCLKRLYMEPRCKVALVTEGATGIGFATAHELLCNDLYRVVITGTDSCGGKDAIEKLNNQFGKNRSCYMILDTNLESNFYDVIKEIIKVFGNLDILVNSPGVPKKKSWEGEIDAKILSVIRGSMIGTELMSKQKCRTGGVIINIASSLAYDNFPEVPVFISYNNSIIGFSQSWGAKPNYQATQVRTIAICPGKMEGMIIENSLEPNDKELAGIIGKLPSQSLSSVSRSILYTIQYAPSGTVWFVDGGDLNRGRIPHRHKYSEKIRYV